MKHAELIIMVLGGEDMAAKKILLDSAMQERLWALLSGQEEVVADVMGTEIRLTIVKPSNEDEIAHEIESYDELREMMNSSEEDIRTKQKE